MFRQHLASPDNSVKNRKKIKL